MLISKRLGFDQDASYNPISGLAMDPGLVRLELQLALSASLDASRDVEASLGGHNLGGNVRPSF